MNLDFLMTGIATIQNGKRQAQWLPPVEARMRRALGRIAESDCPVLILGEHGAGKRSMAAQIHALSSRSRGAFREMGCKEAGAAALTAALATHGTIYLYDVTDLSIALQECIVDAYSRSEPAPACRLLCGSSREPAEEVKLRRMREDFYYLVSAVTLRIPPLRCRKAEILSMAEELLTQYSRQFDRPKPVLSKESIEHLMEYNWPENLSELQTVLKTFVAIGDQAISLAAIKAATSGRSNGDHRRLLLKEATRASSIQIERQLITEVLVSTGGNRKRAAAELGISYKALLYKLKQMETDNPSLSRKNGVAL
jgi:two-component system response regulator AtoC